MKAAHLKKVNERAALARDALGQHLTRDLWVGRMTEAIRHLRGRDGMAKKSRQVAAGALWMLISQDITELTTEVWQLNRITAAQRAVLAKHDLLEEVDRVLSAAEQCQSPLPPMTPVEQEWSEERGLQHR